MKKRIPSGTRVPEEAYKFPILEALYELGESARVNPVLRIVERKTAGLLSEIDYEPLPTTGEPRWRNTAKWGRQRLVEDGLMRADSDRGMWELTVDGKRAVEGDEG